MVRHLTDEEFNLIKNMANAAGIEDRTKAPKGEVMYSSENGFFYLRSEFGEGSNESNCSFEEFARAEMKMEEYIPTYIPSFDDLEPWMYNPYPHVPTFYTTVLYGRKASKCQPSKAMIPLFFAIKYGEGLNKYWRVDWYDGIKKEIVRKEGNSKGGSVTKEESPNKGQHGKRLSDKELISRMNSDDKKKAFDARSELKNRGYTIVKRKNGRWRTVK